ncbi:hypothetical protein [Pedobacter agri]|uniref:Uncharacterized protein n=1 Tax=Pedobacter agri TaxID=454586 RepID=A0A9X3IB20_9SPHI|nr:hypothetical protein [Pedobacter agri]MCX3267491.1 hypothetical protein [Pedobacter agri]
MRKIIINIIPALFVLTIAQLCIVGKISISIGIIILGLFLVMSLILLIIGFKNKDYALMFIFPIAIISVLFFKFITHNQYNENMARCESVFKKLDNYDKNRGKFPNDLSEAYSKDEQ